MIEIHRFGRPDLPSIRPILLDVYAEVYADDIATDPFMSVPRFDTRLTSHAASAGWEAVVGFDDGDPVGYGYGSPVPTGGSGRWDTVAPRPSPRFSHESGTRTFVLFELMVRQPWRGTGLARRVHDHLLHPRQEDRVTLTVDIRHPKVQRLYENWGYRRIGTKQPFPDSPVFAVMVRGLTSDLD